MHVGKKIVSIAAAAALVAGAGAIASTPASAAKTKKTTVKGSTNVTVPLSFVLDAAEQGVVIDPIEPASELADMDAATFTFPAAGPAGDGILRHRGGISFASSNTGITIDLVNPAIEWFTDVSPVTEAQITFVNQINKQRVAVFDVKDVNRKVTFGKPVKDGKSGWKRTDRERITGSVFVVDNATAVKAFNEVMDVDLFTPGMAFGTLDSSASITVYCKTKQACTIKR